MSATSPITKLGRKRFPVPIPAFPRIISEEITVSTIGHVFGEIPPEFFATQSPLYLVHDFLPDESQSAGAGHGGECFHAAVSGQPTLEGQERFPTVLEVIYGSST
jgi:hypothetical protein